MPSGSAPVTALQARHASTKVMTWPLSSQAPRATMILRPPASVAMRGSNGGVVPQIERVDRLHVVVAVEQDARPVAVAGARRPPPDDRPCGRTEVAKPIEARSAAT